MSLQGWVEAPISLATDGPALNTSITATSLIGPTTNVASAAKLVLPSNFFVIGKTVRVTATGRMSNIVTTPGTLTMDLRLGATVVFNGGAIPLNIVAKTNVTWRMVALLTCRAVGMGTLTTLIGVGDFTSESVISSVAGTANDCMLPATAPAVGTGFDSTAAQQFDLFGTWSISNAGNSIQLQQLVIEQLN